MIFRVNRGNDWNLLGGDNPQFDDTHSFVKELAPARLGK
jgi:hypothetical protein